MILKWELQPIRGCFGIAYVVIYTYNYPFDNKCAAFIVYHALVDFINLIKNHLKLHMLDLGKIFSFIHIFETCSLHVFDFYVDLHPDSFLRELENPYFYSKIIFHSLS